IGLTANRGERLALVIAPTLLVLTRILTPLLVAIARLGRIDGKRAAMDAFTESELRQLASIGLTTGESEEHERELSERTFRLDETKTWEIMVPRVDIFAWPDATRLIELVPHLATV